MTDMSVQMVVNTDNRRFIRPFSRSETSINRFGKQIPGVIRRSGRKICRFGYKIGGLSIAAGKSLIDFDVRLARWATQAGLSKKQMFDLKKELFKIGEANEGRIYE